MYFKVHDFPRPQYKRVVFLVRDGRDVVVLSRTTCVTFTEMMSIWPNWPRATIAGSPTNTPGPIMQRLAGKSLRRELITIRFEDLKADPMTHARRFCEFVGIDRDDAITRAVAFASFDQMREREQRLGMDYRTWPKDKPFVRRGEVGSHKDEMPPRSSRSFCARPAP